MSRKLPAATVEEQIEQLVEQADDLPEGPAKVAIYEEAVALADAHNQIELGYDTRMQMLWPAYHASRQDLLLVHFAWCLAQLDADPEGGLDEHEALWAYRWVLDTMPGFPDIPRAQIEAAVQDMERRYEAHAFSLRPCYLLQRRVYRGLGDRAAAMASHKKIAKTRRDWLSDDLETEQAFAVFYSIFRERYADAVRSGQKLLAGSISQHFRGLVMTDLVMPLVRLNRWDEAAAYHAASLPILKAERQSAGNFALHIEYMTVTGALPKAIKLFEQHWAPAVLEPNRITRFDYFRSGKFLCETLIAKGSKAKIRLPDVLNIPGAVDGRISAAELDPWLGEQLRELVAIFDARNRTTFFAEELARVAAFHKLSEAFAGEPNSKTRQKT